MSKKIFYVILGGVLFTNISVLATAIISSGVVNYDNSESGLSSIKVEGAIDELYDLYVSKSQYDTDLATAEATCPSDVCITTEEYNELSTSQNGCTGQVNRKQVGDLVTLPATKDGVTTNEEFYVISSNECTTTLITRYNLYVGAYCSGENSCTAISKSTSGYGVQNSFARGYIGGSAFASLKFSISNYWYANSALKSEYKVNGASFSGKPYPYVYDSNSNLDTYIENYKSYLGSIVKTARLATYEEMNKLGCTTSSNSCPDWISYTSFWTGSAYSSSNVWIVGALDGYLSNSPYSNKAYSGVRPVIVISTSDIP